MRRTNLLFNLALLSGCSEVHGPELYIEMVQPGSCSVRGVVMDCADVPTYLRKTAMAPTDTYIAVSVSAESSSYQPLQELVEALKAVGYTSVIGEIALQPNKTMEPTR
jgi:hypothetical protein